MTTATEKRGMFPYSVKRPDTASQSLLARIDVCPFSGALYIDYKGGPQTAALARGEVCHHFFERATNMLMEQEEPSMPPEVGKDLMQAIIEERTDLALPAGEQESCRIIAWNWSEATVLDLNSIVCVESMLSLQIGEWTVRGRVDRAEIADRQAFVRDYKTSLAIPDQEKFERSFQTPFYALLVAEGVPEGESTPIGEGLDACHLIEEYPRYRRGDDGSLASRITVVDRAQLFDFKRTVESHLAKLDHGLAKGEWAASPGAHCQTCPASSECPIPPHLREVKTIGTQGDAEEIAQRILFVDAQAKELKTSLRGWVDENGPVYAGDLVFDLTYAESERLTDKDAVKRIVEEAGYDPETFWRKSPSTRFGKSKVKA
jgi:RecB family exonuclease